MELALISVIFLNVSDLSKHLFSIYYPSIAVIIFSPSNTCLHAQ